MRYWTWRSGVCWSSWDRHQGQHGPFGFVLFSLIFFPCITCHTFPSNYFFSQMSYISPFYQLLEYVLLHHFWILPKRPNLSDFSCGVFWKRCLIDILIIFLLGWRSTRNKQHCKCLLSMWERATVDWINQVKHGSSRVCLWACCISQGNRWLEKENWGMGATQQCVGFLMFVCFKENFALIQDKMFTGNENYSGDSH